MQKKSWFLALAIALIGGFFCMSGCTGSDSGNPVTGTDTGNPVTFAGILLDSSNVPVAACTVTVRKITVPASSQARLAKVGIDADTTQATQTLVTDSTGEFVVRGLAQGQYAVVALDRNRSQGVLFRTTLTAADSTPKPSQLQMAGLVNKTWHFTTAQIGSRVTLVELGTSYLITDTVMTIQDVPPGDYTLAVTPFITWTSANKGSYADTRDQSLYSVVRIGNYVWLGSNLSYDVSGSSCHPSDSYANCRGYGRFYTLAQAKSACPDGWRLPEQSDWSSTAFVAGGSLEAAGSALKSTTGWVTPGTDLFGFSAHPYGSAQDPSTGTKAAFWSNTPSVSADMAISVQLSADSTGIIWADEPESSGFSVRCITSSYTETAF